MNLLSLRCPALDQLLGGGLELGIITKVFGEAGTGKTTMCLQAARECFRQGGHIVFIDTEGVSTERLRQLCEHDKQICAIYDSLLFIRPRTFYEQEQAVQKACAMNDISLIIIDTMNRLYRVALTHDIEEARRCYVRQMTSLQLNARKHRQWVLLAEQVYTDEQGVIQPFTNKKTESMVKIMVKLEKRSGRGMRTARLVKHPLKPLSSVISFRLTTCGME